MGHTPAHPNALLQQPRPQPGNHPSNPTGAAPAPPLTPAERIAKAKSSLLIVQKQFNDFHDELVYMARAMQPESAAKSTEQITHATTLVSERKITPQMYVELVSKILVSPPPPDLVQKMEILVRWIFTLITITLSCC